MFATCYTPLQICLFCTIWHQTQQTAERWLLLVVPPLKKEFIAALRASPRPTFLAPPLRRTFSSPGAVGAGRILQQLSGKSSEWLITGRNRGMMWLACPLTCQHITAHVLLIHRAVNQRRTSGKLSRFTVQQPPDEGTSLKLCMIISPNHLETFQLFSSHL